MAQISQAAVALKDLHSENWWERQRGTTYDMFSWPGPDADRVRPSNLDRLLKFLPRFIIWPFTKSRRRQVRRRSMRNGRKCFQTECWESHHRMLGLVILSYSIRMLTFLYLLPLLCRIRYVASSYFVTSNYTENFGSRVGNCLIQLGIWITFVIFKFRYWSWDANILRGTLF